MGGEELEFDVPERRETALEPEPVAGLRVAYEDEHLLVVDKPAGVVVHPASGHRGATLSEALAGRIYVSEQLRVPALEELMDPVRRHARSTIELTPRQREVLQLLAEGKSAKEIAAILDISPRTVETHKYKMMDDLGVKSSAELVQHAVRHGLVAP